MSDVNPPAGWYVSPKDKSLLQWWDGDSWADITQPLNNSVTKDAPHGFELVKEKLDKPEAGQLIDYVVGGAMTAGGAAIAVDGAANLVKKKTGAGKWFILSAFLMLIAVPMAIQAVAGLFGPMRVEVPGTVVSLGEDSTVDGYCAPVAEFMVNGQKKSVALMDSEECRWTLGEEVAVFYDSGTNGRNPLFGKSTESWDQLYGALGAFVFGVFFLIVGFVKLGARGAQAGIGAVLAKKGYDKLKKTSEK